MTEPQRKPRRAQRVVRLNKLPEYTGNKQTINDQLIQLGLLRPFSMSVGGRSKVVTEDNILELQEAAQTAGSIEALIAQAKEKQAAASKAREASYLALIAQAKLKA